MFAEIIDADIKTQILLYIVFPCDEPKIVFYICRK